MYDKLMFQYLLNQMDIEHMQQYSVINHHVDGMNYLCLSRTDNLTVKIYMMEKPENPNNGFLVNPHSHRYAFSSIVLAGYLNHYLFYERKDWGHIGPWNHFRYNPDNKSLVKIKDSMQFDHSSTYYGRGESYFVDAHETHTLRVGKEPFMLGLVQFADERETSDLYLPTHSDKMLLPNSRKPTIVEMQEMRIYALELLKGFK